MKVGINSVAFDVPKIFLSIEKLAEARGIEADKLIKGLGLKKMTFLDVHQDVVTLAANALIKLIEDNDIELKSVSRIYVGTESGVDSSKPIASYLVSIIEGKYGSRVLANCDVVDLTFACIGGIDALQNCVDYIKLNPDEKAIIVTTDFAKYDLASTGEYTQGAGAIAMEVTAYPDIISFESKTGVSTEGVFDFFKPRRVVQKNAIVNDENNAPWNGVLESEIAIYKEQPVFDGQYSNVCYINRIKEAYLHFKTKNEISHKVYEDWKYICLHLPYCFQGRRTFIEIFAEENHDLLQNQEGETIKDKMKGFVKSSEYSQLVIEKIFPSEIASGQVGNIYTGSIFLGFLSSLYQAYHSNENVTNNKIGFIAYGSGSKSKVFEGIVQPSYSSKIAKLKMFEVLDNLKEIDFRTYEALHKKETDKSILTPEKEVKLSSIETEKDVLIGARYYEIVE